MEVINIESKVFWGRAEQTSKRNVFWVLMPAVLFDFSLDSLSAILATF